MFKGEKGKAMNDSPDRLNRLVSGTVLEGTLRTESSLRVDGEVKGDLICSGKLVLGNSGKVHGNLKSTEAEIEGNVTGNVEVENVLILRATARIQGDIKTGRLVIEDGADFNGSCLMSGAVTPKNSSKKNNLVQDTQADVVY